MSALAKPGKLNAAGILMLVSGILQFPTACVMASVSGFVVSFVMGILTIWAGGIGALCGYCSVLVYALWAVGIIEIIAGILILALPKPPRLLLQLVSVAEVLCLFLGGIPAAIAGIINVILSRDPEVVAYLEVSPLPPE
jgi:hypothetical protein